MRSLIAGLFTCVAFLILLELLFRGMVYINKGSKEDRFLVLPHHRLGWVLNPQMRPKSITNRCGEVVELISPPHSLILKYPQGNGKRKIVFLGDSFTHAHEVSTGKAYFDIFERLEQGNYEVYAVAVGGYGNLQEYLALQEVFDEIEPDIVAWQLTGNDVSNNVFELDDSSIWNSQRLRPYLNPDNGAIEMRNPGLWMFDWSDGFAYVFKKLLIIDSRYKLGIIRWLDSINAMDRDTQKILEERGLAVLEYVIREAVSTFSDTTFIGFSVDPQFDRKYEEIFTRNGGSYLPAFYKALNAVDATDCRPLDSHWNHTGNQVAGAEFSNRLSELRADR